MPPINSHVSAPNMLYLKADNGKLSGRADGNVYMRNGRVRGFTVPALVRNAFTSIARTNLASMSSAWNALTEVQRLTWLNANGIFRSDRFGNPVEIKGKELFVLCNTNLLNVGSPTLTDFPVISIPPVGLTSLSGAASVGGGTNVVVFTATPISANEKLLVFATAPQRAGVSRPSQSAYRLIQATAISAASPINIFANYNAKYGVPTVGTKIFIRVVSVAIGSGLTSAKTDANYVVIA